MCSSSIFVDHDNLGNYLLVCATTSREITQAPLALVSGWQAVVKLAQVVVIHDDTHWLAYDTKRAPKHGIAQEGISKRAIDCFREKDHRCLSQHANKGVEIDVLKGQGDDHLVHESRKDEYCESSDNLRTSQTDQRMVYRSMSQKEETFNDRGVKSK